MEKGAREGLSYQQMALALSATKVPRSVIREWMFDSGCGNDLVSIESVAALRDHLRPLQEPKWFAIANGANQAHKVIDLDIPELGEVVTPLCDGWMPRRFVHGLSMHCQGIWMLLDALCTTADATAPAEMWRQTHEVARKRVHPVHLR